MASENKKQINQYTIDLNNVIGEGSYSVVYKGLNEDT
jgi:methionine-rich copper-binding protein CopC